ncbi:hypothetical protein CSHISOI_08898, partial [Colletotrichum shisoi]
VLQSWLTPVSVCFLAQKQCFCSTIILLFICHDATQLPILKARRGDPRTFSYMHSPTKKLHQGLKLEPNCSMPRTKPVTSWSTQ